MGMRTTLYGYIEEMDFWLDPVKTKVREHNSNIISLLPKADNWPPLSLEMFAICNNDNENLGPNFEYSGRIIHFGANLKSVELEWTEWRTKFENLLLNLFFLEAKVHFQTEYSELQTSSWTVDLLKYKIRHDDTMPIKIGNSVWEYESTWDK
jgi:hypothetical protein